jgi:ABC-type antimicrobial peptide transport system permease subunit
VRAAIGASRGRLVRQFLTESILLALLGTAFGVLLAVASVRALIAASPVPLPRLDAGAVGVDGRLLLFAIAAATLTSVAFGVVPAMLMARGDMQRPLKESGRGGDGSGARRRTRSLLVAPKSRWR